MADLIYFIKVIKKHLKKSCTVLTYYVVKATMTEEEINDEI
jgi:hypothetical protein